MTRENPLAPASDGRNSDGTFAKGNRAGRGNPMARKAQQLRAAMFRSVKSGDVRTIIAAMVDKARGGDVAAAKLVLQYTLGDPQPLDFVERLESLETLRRIENESQHST